ncbi:Serine/threonine kinase [Umezakia ovalisporum]|nr:Serine/threonine kinase [Umezakia ovalisporum]
MGVSSLASRLVNCNI